MIFTFYSYKGGVGRTMALANIAELFYESGLKVLIVDWDLEAPGLERFFFEDTTMVFDQPGIIDILLDYKEKMTTDWDETKREEGLLPSLNPSQVAIDIYPNSSGEGKLWLITAGKRPKEDFSQYAHAVLSFDWHDFYENWDGEVYVEWLREQFEELADIILVDSRTGITEIGGICTYQLADVITIFCAPNQQNIGGTYEMVNNFLQTDVQKLRHNQPLEVLIVPARVEDRAERELLGNFERQFVEKFDQFIPNELSDILESFWQFKIPYVPYFAFNEIKAVIEEKGGQSFDDIVRAFSFLKRRMWELMVIKLVFKHPEEGIQEIAKQFSFLISNDRVDEMNEIVLLINNLMDPLENFAPIFDYAKSMAAFVRGNQTEAASLLDSFLDAKGKLYIGKIELPVPEEVRRIGQLLRRTQFSDIKTTPVNIASFDPSALKSSVGSALRNWHTIGGTDESLLAFLLLVQQVRQQFKDVSPSTLRLATNNVLMAALSQLEKENEEGVRILHRRFQDGEQIRAVAVEMNISEFTVSHKQREAIEQLANLLAEQEAVVWQERIQAIEARLPPPSYTRLFGVAEPQALLADKLLAEAEPWLTAVVGIGGIGKTSLARAVTSQVIQHFRFADAVWVKLESTSISGRFTSPEQLRDTLLAAISDHLWPEQAGESTPHGRLLRVRQALKQQPILVIIDNLESAVDTANLLDYLRDLANPSKFLLTSRTRPAGAFSVSLDQLPLAAATELVRYHIQNGNIEGAEALRDEDIAAIYEHTGGNPLALIFVVKLLDSMTWSHILDGLKSVNIEKVEELYRHIYWQNWQMISEDARTLLQAMVLVPREGGKLDYLKVITELGKKQLQSAVTELRHSSLLEISGDVHTRRYSIHPLTKSFLKAEIIRLSSDSPSESETSGM